MLPQLNGKRKHRLGLEHFRTYPPFGAIMNGEIVKGEDEHYYLTAEMVYFDKQEIITLEDGTKLLKESFSVSNYFSTFPFKIKTYISSFYKINRVADSSFF